MRLVPLQSYIDYLRPARYPMGHRTCGALEFCKTRYYKPSGALETRGSAEKRAEGQEISVTPPGGKVRYHPPGERSLSRSPPMAGV